jgi:hypothetical protein
MAHGKTLELREITLPDPEYVKRYDVEQDPRTKLLVKVGDWSPFTGSRTDRALSGKARIRARRAIR